MLYYIQYNTISLYQEKIMSHFSEELKSIRLKHGLTQAALANELHVTQNAVFNWENGKREPTIAMIQKIADYFQVSAAYFFAEKESYRTVLRFLDQSAKRKASDLVVRDETDGSFIAIECTEGDTSYDSLIAYAGKCCEWYEKICGSLNEEGRRKVAEYAEILSGSERFQRK